MKSTTNLKRFLVQLNTMNNLYVSFKNVNTKEIYKRKKATFIELYLDQKSINPMQKNIKKKQNSVKSSSNSKIQNDSIKTLPRKKIQIGLKNFHHHQYDSDTSINELYSDSSSNQLNEPGHRFNKVLIDNNHKHIQKFVKNLKKEKSKMIYLS